MIALSILVGIFSKPCQIDKRVSNNGSKTDTSASASRLIEIFPQRRRLLESGEHVLRWLLLIVPILGLFFVFSSVILIDVWDDDNEARCYATIIVCLVFYFGVKICEYLFMIERAHQLRRRTLFRHLADCWYLVEFLGLVVGFGVIAFFAFERPTAVISPTDGLCLIGVPPDLAVSVLGFDVIFNLILTIDFCVLAWRISPIRCPRELVKYLSVALPFRRLEAASNDFQKIRKFQIGRVIWGLVAITIPTITNLAVLARMDGREHGWLCLALCTSDITWTVVVIHWLTSKPSYSGSTLQQQQQRLSELTTLNKHGIQPAQPAQPASVGTEPRVSGVRTEVVR